MPVRSLSSSVMVWPSAEKVYRAAREWAERLAQADRNVLAVGYFGSYARGDWGVGSDLDLVVIIDVGVAPGRLGQSQLSLPWGVDSLPVPAELVVYSAEEWNDLRRSNLRMGQVLRDETVWLVGDEAA
jgi:predicted nucleotidyltransferase